MNRNHWRPIKLPINSNIKSHYIGFEKMITKFSPVLLAIIISVATFAVVWRKNPHAKWIQLTLCIFAFVTTTFHNLNHNYHFIFWLCNFTVLLGIGLCFRFHQTVFNVFFYFCWTGSLLTLFIFNNPVAGLFL